jgi:hypothetical protein
LPVEWLSGIGVEIRLGESVQHHPKHTILPAKPVQWHRKKGTLRRIADRSVPKPKYVSAKLCLAGPMLCRHRR